MENNIWDIECEPIEEKELTEEEKQLAEYCSDIEMTLKETISMINNFEE
mgnify:CR=1 FL=1